MDEEGKTKSKKGKGAFVGKLVLLLVFVALTAGGTVYAIQQKPELLGLSKGQEIVQAEVDMLLEELGKLINLPSDESPTVATVSDASKLTEQSFFKNAQNGDKVVIYTTARKAILYRPSEKRIVEVGAVNIQQRAAATPNGSATPAPTATGAPASNE